MTEGTRRLETLLLLIIVAAYLVIAALYAVKTPAWQVPDEPAHYNYVAQVARNGCCPVLQMGDWDNAYLDKLKAEGFNPSLLGRLSSIRYEDHQPPLYYLLSAPIFAATNGSLLALRLFSVLLGAGIVLAAYAVVRVVFPGQPPLALATAAFLAFLPQHVAMMAGVENDSLTELIVAVGLLATVIYLGNGSGRVHPLALGLIVGLGLITKTTAYSLVVIIGVAVLLRARREGWSLRRLLSQAAWVVFPALILGGAWWLRNFSVYGFPDFMGLQRHDQVVVGQYRTAQYIADKGLAFVLSDGVQTTFRSFWGQFGWMGVVMPGWAVGLLALFTGIVIIGAGIAFAQFRARLTAPQRDALIILGLSALLAFALFFYYNLSFVQFQGRYLYTGLIPISLFVAVGLTGWASLVPTRAARWAIVAVTSAFALFAIYALYRFIIPALPNWS